MAGPTLRAYRQNPLQTFPLPTKVFYGLQKPGHPHQESVTSLSLINLLAAALIRVGGNTSYIGAPISNL